MTPALLRPSKLTLPELFQLVSLFVRWSAWTRPVTSPFADLPN
jgi:hypothetical protein